MELSILRPIHRSGSFRCCILSGCSWTSVFSLLHTHCFQVGKASLVFAGCAVDCGWHSCRVLSHVKGGGNSALEKYVCQAPKYTKELVTVSSMRFQFIPVSWVAETNWHCSFLVCWRMTWKQGFQPCVYRIWKKYFLCLPVKHIFFLDDQSYMLINSNIDYSRKSSLMLLVANFSFPSIFSLYTFTNIVYFTTVPCLHVSCSLPKPHKLNGLGDQWCACLLSHLVSISGCTVFSIRSSGFGWTKSQRVNPCFQRI